MLSRTRDRERGSAVVEAVIGVPAFLLLVGLLVLGGRVTLAHQAVQEAASDAARAASIARTEATARSDAADAARQTLANQHQECASTTVSVDLAGFRTAVGIASQVSATVSCELRLDDLGIPGLTGTRTITATMSSPLDTYRERSR